jgi:preprotein translocase subunit SecG
MMINVLLGLHLILCVILIGIVLLQQGKGADLGANLSGGSDSLFGASGATDFITRLTTTVAIAFMVTSIFLVRYYNRGGSFQDGTLETLQSEALKDSVFKDVQTNVEDQVQVKVTPNVTSTTSGTSVIKEESAVTKKEVSEDKSHKAIEEKVVEATSSKNIKVKD